jgi:exopolysaccharide biosynthesis protein
MLNRSAYRHRHLYAWLVALLLTLASTFVMLDTFVLAREVDPIFTPAASLTFTPVPTQPEATPVQKVYTDTEYTDEHIRIKITKVVKPNLVYFVADIKMDSVQYFKNSFAYDKYARHKYEAPSVQAKRHNAILAINSDDCGYNETKLTIRDGILYHDNFKEEILVLMKTGEMKIAKGVSGMELVEQGALHTWSFGPTLVLDGKYVERKSNVAVANPRTGMGMIEPLHYIFIVVDGRKPGYSTGLEMKDFAQLFVEYGCSVAYNLDGGGSSLMIFNDKIVNVPCLGRERQLTDIIYIGLE